jgi:hypothetical protein
MRDLGRLKSHRWLLLDGKLTIAIAYHARDLRKLRAITMCGNSVVRLRVA